jgi:hypothetical protein
MIMKPTKIQTERRRDQGQTKDPADDPDKMGKQGSCKVDMTHQGLSTRSLSFEQNACNINSGLRKERDGGT